MRGLTPDRPGRSRENRCPMQESRRRDRIWESHAHQLRTHSARLRLSPDSIAARKHTSACLEVFFPTLLANARALANLFLPLETPRCRRDRQEAYCEGPLDKLRNPPACSFSHHGQTVWIGLGRIGPKLMPE